MTNHKKTGNFVMIDGMDGSGKSTITRALVEHFTRNQKTVFDIPHWSKEHGRLPTFEECAAADIILSAEPTHVWIGTTIRQELIRQGTSYSEADIATAFSLDRLVLYTRLIIPLLEAGKTVIQDRGVPTSLAYQTMKNLRVEDVARLPGNTLALEHAPDTLIIADCSVDTALQRLAGRSDKDDNSIFEKRSFLEALYEHYHADWFKKIWLDKNTKLIYLNTEPSIEEVSRAAKLMLTIPIGEKP